MEWLDGNKIQIIPPKRPKKLTGTRFATILGLNPWSTPFEIWCEVTRTYQKPFEDTIYTIAGKTIEPKQAEYMKQTYFMSNLVTPTDIWGKDYFRQTYGDFFKESPVLGGMWDYLLYGKDGKPIGRLISQVGCTEYATLVKAIMPEPDGAIKDCVRIFATPDSTMTLPITNDDWSLIEKSDFCEILYAYDLESDKSVPKALLVKQYAKYPDDEDQLVGIIFPCEYTEQLNFYTAKEA